MSPTYIWDAIYSITAVDTYHVKGAHIRLGRYSLKKNCRCTPHLGVPPVPGRCRRHANVYMHVHIRTHARTHTHTHTHAYTRIRIRVHILRFCLIGTRMHIKTHMHNRTHVYIHVHVHTYTCIRKCAHAHTHTHIHALQVERADIKAAMVFALDCADAGAEIVETLADALTLPETPVPLKIARCVCLCVCVCACVCFFVLFRGLPVWVVEVPGLVCFCSCLCVFLVFP